MNITQILFDQVQRRPEALAIRHASGELTYGEFGARVAGVAAGLVHSGLRAKEVVAIRLDDPLAHWTATLALAHMGAIVVSIPRSMPELQRERLMGLTKCTRILAGDEYPPTVASAAEEELRWSAIEACGAGGLPGPAVVDPDQPWIYVSGSGSMGRPKIMPITHGQELACTESASKSFSYACEDSIHSMVAMHFSSAKRRALEVIYSGAVLHLLPLAPIDLMLSVAEGRVSVIHATVFHVEGLLARLANEGDGRFNKLKSLFLGQSVVSAGLRGRIRRILTANLYVRYSANEAGTICLAGPDACFGFSGTVGRPSVGFQVEIVDESGKVLPPRYGWAYPGVFTGSHQRLSRRP